jgi:protein-tyrosine phosphatase
MTRHILFVCLGNICRSPAAEAVLRAKATRAGLMLEVDSAGTGGWHVGEPPHPAMITAAKARGYRLEALRARQLSVSDFAQFDMILTMDHANLRNASALRAQAGMGPVPELFLTYAPDCGLTEVPDPWYTGDFDQTLDLLEVATEGLIAALCRKDQR